MDGPNFRSPNSGGEQMDLCSYRELTLAVQLSNSRFTDLVIPA